ncbi:hypothetical protein [Halopelagius fulvigenes]|uniref:Uncharacterized protein n=1 Tax=Halopelagius fulvigenes TaxID=1198324 RepID=A0ABD5TS97_9EURY
MADGQTTFNAFARGVTDDTESDADADADAADDGRADVAEAGETLARVYETLTGEELVPASTFHVGTTADAARLTKLSASVVENAVEERIPPGYRPEREEWVQDAAATLGRVYATLTGEDEPIPEEAFDALDASDIALLTKATASMIEKNVTADAEDTPVDLPYYQ